MTSEHMNLERGEIYEPGHRFDDDLMVLDHIGGTRKVDIYRCRGKSIGGYVVCKVLRPEYCIHFKSLSAVGAEAEMLARFDHPNVMKAHSFTLQPVPIIVMDHVDGQDLKTAFFTGNYSAFSINEALRIVSQLADGLSHVHSRGVLHLDVKPSNIMYELGRAVLIDFSVAREFDPDDLPRDNAGTRDWMAPEQTARETVGPYTDVFGLGVVMYQLLTGGELPFPTTEVEKTDSDDDQENRTVKVPNYEHSVAHPSDLNPDVSREIGDIAMKAISLDPSDRFADPAEFMNAVDAFIQA